MTASCRTVYQLAASMEKMLGAAEIDRRRDYLQYSGRTPVPHHRLLFQPE